ncbi:MAG: nucleotide-diphospho-sugar transferase [Pseudomonadota bacterium]
MTDFIPPAPLETPVLFLIFNRPDTTAKVFEAIRKARPPRLYVAADGAREDRDGESERVADVRKIATRVDWPCEVKTLFRDRNLGCRDAVSEGITWFFENEEAGIILEDDCLPSQSFFWFCEAMLERYRHDTRVGQISGLMRFPETLDSAYSHAFSRFGSIWGWASWRRAWQFYAKVPSDEVMQHLEDIFRTVTFDEDQLRRRVELIEAVAEGNIDTWDYQWGLTKYAQHMLSVVPTNNLVENIGLDTGTHNTNKAENKGLSRNEMSFPLRFLDIVYPQQSHDHLFANRTKKTPRLRRILKKAGFDFARDRSSE